MSNASPDQTASLPHIPGLEPQEKIGEGGMGVVYRALHLALRRAVAVKVLRGEAAAGPDWLREARLMASLAHPYVVTIHDAGQAEGHNYLVMEYMAGGSLRSRLIPGRRWPVVQAVPVLDRVAQALDHIHEQGILHLDLKPENILYSADGHIKITDFGLSVPRAGVTALLETRGGQGTADYCAPEQRSGLGLDARCDVFSLATMAYELLTGRLPGRVYVPASERAPGLPAALDDVLRRGLARDPKDRYESVAQFRQALADACRPTGVRARTRLMVAGAALTALGAALFALNGRQTGTTTAVPPPERPTHSWVLYDRPGDLSLFAGEDGGEWAGGSDVAVERVRVENPRQALPPELPLPVWPTPRPVLVVRSPNAWGFVHPLQDPTLGRRVLENWSALLEAVVPPEKNFVKAGGFDGDCLATNHRGHLWRVGDAADWNAERQITLDRPGDRPDNPALRLTRRDPAGGKGLLGCYQPLARGPGPGAVVVLRYRARAEQGNGSLAVYAGMPVVIPDGEAGPAAARIRALGSPLPPGPDDPTPNRWLYRSPAWVTPSADWRTYLVIAQHPPFSPQVIHRNLVIDLAATGEVWVDDVELFVWRPGGAP